MHADGIASLFSRTPSNVQVDMQLLPFQMSKSGVFLCFLNCRQTGCLMVVVQAHDMFNTIYNIMLDITFTVIGFKCIFSTYTGERGMGTE